jgi:hypothetical protein
MYAKVANIDYNKVLVPGSKKRLENRGFLTTTISNKFFQESL